MFWDVFWWFFTPIGQIVALALFVVFVAALITFFYLLWRLEHGE